jgi:hypothetical protein
MLIILGVFENPFVHLLLLIPFMIKKDECSKECRATVRIVFTTLKLV